MKTKPHLISVLLLIVVSIITACNKESKCTGVNYSYITNETRNNLFAPLTGSDTIKFLYNNKDTQIYVGQGAQQDWHYVYGGDPSLCDSKYEKLIFVYKCINAPDFYFRLEYDQYGNLSKDGKSVIYSNYSFKNVNVGEFEISALTNDSILINGNWFYEPSYRANGPDTMQYFMFCSRNKNPQVCILKIKYLNNELTLLK